MPARLWFGSTNRPPISLPINAMKPTTWPSASQTQFSVAQFQLGVAQLDLHLTNLEREIGRVLLRLCNDAGSFHLGAGSDQGRDFGSCCLDLCDLQLGSVVELVRLE